MNSNKIEWTVGETPISNLSYTKKKNHFGGNNDYNSYGIEYYNGGIFYMPDDKTDQIEITQSESSEIISKATSIIPETTVYELIESLEANIDSFDGRDRHNQDWMTPVKNQLQCGSCVIFGVTATVEL